MTQNMHIELAKKIDDREWRFSPAAGAKPPHVLCMELENQYVDNSEPTIIGFSPLRNSVLGRYSWCSPALFRQSACSAFSV